MFQLEISEDNITNCTVAVSWCLDQSVIDKLASGKIADPQVVICVAPVDRGAHAAPDAHQRKFPSARTRNRARREGRGTRFPRLQTRQDRQGNGPPRLPLLLVRPRR